MQQTEPSDAKRLERDRLSPRRTRAWLVAILLATAAVRAATLLAPRERLLLNRATRVAVLDANDVWLWRTEHTAVVLQYRPDMDRYEFSQYDPLTRARTPMDDLNTRLTGSLSAQTHIYSASSPAEAITTHAPNIDASISPDGSWLVVHATYSDSNFLVPIYASYVGYEIDRKTEAKWECGWSTADPIWFSDGNRWLVAGDIKAGQYKDVLIQHDVREPRKTFRTAMPAESTWPYPIGATRDENLIQVDQITSRQTGRASTAIESETAIRGAAARKKHVTSVSLPRGWESNDVKLSREGDRLAWILQRDDIDSITAFLHRILPSVPQRSSSTVGLWVSDLHGGSMKEIGRLPATIYWQPRGISNIAPLGIRHWNEGIDNVQWLPGGKKLSFTYHGALYTVPAP